MGLNEIRWQILCEKWSDYESAVLLMGVTMLDLLPDGP
jgi:hypothetical protein